MRIGVSPYFASAFPELKNVEFEFNTPYDITLAHYTEREAKWLKRRHRLLRPFFCKDEESARSVLKTFQPSKKKRKPRK